MNLKEAALEREIRDYLALDEWCVRHLELNYSERKQRAVGERGMPDLICIRYHPLPHWANILWIEAKRPLSSGGGRFSCDQMAWTARERRWGATVLQMGLDFEASLEGFAQWYEASGLQRRKVRIGGSKTA